MINFMRWISKFDLFLFDLDGLLVNTEQLHLAAYAAMCKKRGFHLPWDFDRYSSHAHFSDTALKEALAKEFPALFVQEPSWDVLYIEKKKAYMDILKGGGLQLLPGVEVLLKTLATTRIKRCVATNSTKEQVSVIKHFLPALNTIPVWITREQYEKPKPAPDAYLKAIELLADPGDRIIGFEDSLRGIKALQGTQAKPVLVCSPRHPQLKEMNLKDVSHYASFEKIPANAFS